MGLFAILHRTAVIGLGLALAGPAAAQLAPTFIGPTNYATGAGSIATGDFNNDGHLDMAVVNETGGNIAILLGDGAGNFSGPTMVSASVTALFIAAGDFNGDAFTDLVVTSATGSNTLSVLISNGSGGFLPGVSYTIDGGAVGVAVGHFNNDTFLDIGAVLTFPGYVSTLRGAGDGTFTSGPLVDGVFGVGTGIVAADFNGDGMTDLGVSVVGAFYVTLRTGDFTFAPLVQRTVSSESPLAVGHFNNDNLLDVAIARTSGTVRVFLNAGGGAMTPGVILTAPDADRVITADFNGDGHVDIATARRSTSDTVSIFLGNGAGAFTGPTNITLTRPYTMAAGDFNEDSQPDLAVSQLSTDEVLSVHLNTTLAVPGAPTGVTATASDSQVTVSFTAPPDGGSAILDYRVRCTPGPVDTLGTASSIVVPGLTNGTAYMCTVRARNAIGNGPESLASNSATPQAVSVVAVGTSGSPSDAGTAVTFTATVTGSSPTGSIDFRADAATLTGCGAVPLAGGSAQCIATFNTMGTRAITALYTGDAANTPGTGTLAGGQAVIAPTIVLAPVTLPDAVALTPYAATITATGGTAPHTFAVTAGALPGGITLSPAGAVGGTPPLSGTFNFTVTATDAFGFTGSRTYAIAVALFGQTITFGALADVPFGSAPFPLSATGGGSGNPVTFASQTPAICTTGGANGATVTLVAAGACTIRASQAGNATYAAAPDVDRTFNVMAVVPQPPVIGTATSGTGQGSIAFTAPANTGGAPILDYTATCTPGPVSTTGAASPLVVNGLTNGVTYSCTVTARNVAGSSAPSAAASVTPNQRAFTGPIATGTGTATVSFTGGGAACSFAAQGNAALQSAFFIPVSGHPKSPPAGTAPAEFPHGLLDFVLLGCTPGATMSFTVSYPTALPTGTRYWKYGPTSSNTAPHWYQLTATITGNTATFSIVDGGMGDDDLAANGTVVDQGGPGLPPVPAELRQVPTLSTWATILLAALLLMAAMRNGNFRRD